MADSMTPEQRHKCMSHIRSGNTRPELKVRCALFAAGYRFRVNVRTLPGTPDIVLPKYRTCIFVNGCFWHGHKGCPKYVLPQTNTEYWKAKVETNQERDMRDYGRLEALDWQVIVIWECELTQKLLANTMARVEGELQFNKEKWDRYNARRKADRAFSRAESRRKKELLETVRHELLEQFH